MTCDYCGQPAEFVSGAEIYAARPDLADLRFWRCLPCGAHVGCHKGTDRPLGRLANAELRKAKMDAHAAFDPFWKAQGWGRHRAYRWLADALGIKPSAAHIGMFDVEQCRRVVEACAKVSA